MANEKDSVLKGQLTLFEILRMAGDIDRNYTSGEIETAIEKLQKAKHYAQKRENEERRRKEKLEREQMEKEERERKEAHVREVTCMDLPLDWDNVFNSDVRTQGVHADSIPDALILSLTSLGKVDIEYISSVTGEDDLAFYTQWRNANPPVTDSKSKKAESEKRRSLREYIGDAVSGHILETREKMLMTYRGFDIVLPANMTKEKPYVWLTRQGKYYVELGDTEVGNLIRIDNYLDEHLEKLKNSLSELEKKEREIKAELGKNESFADKIEVCKKRVEELDRKLGVNKK